MCFGEIFMLIKTLTTSVEWCRCPAGKARFRWLFTEAEPFPVQTCLLCDLQRARTGYLMSHLTNHSPLSYILRSKNHQSSWKRPCILAHECTEIVSFNLHHLIFRSSWDPFQALELNVHVPLHHGFWLNVSKRDLYPLIKCYVPFSAFLTYI